MWYDLIRKNAFMNNHVMLGSVGVNAEVFLLTLRSEGCVGEWKQPDEWI